jgi:hypothetical protein
MQLVIGTYERFLLGYQVPDDLQGAAAADQACNPTRAFTYAAHQVGLCAVTGGCHGVDTVVAIRVCQGSRSK